MADLIWTVSVFLTPNSILIESVNTVGIEKLLLPTAKLRHDWKYDITH